MCNLDHILEDEDLDLKESQDEEDVDLKDLSSNVTPQFRVGSRVRILKGKYKGELGTIKNKSNYWGYYVSLDGAEDINDSITYQADQLELVDAKPGLMKKVTIKRGRFADQVGYVVGYNAGHNIYYVHPESVDDPENPESEWQVFNFRPVDIEFLPESEEDVDMKDLDTAPVIHWEALTVKGRGRTPSITYVYAQLPNEKVGENVGVIHHYGPAMFVVQYTRKRGIHSLEQRAAFPTLDSAVEAVKVDHMGTQDLFYRHRLITQASRALGEMLDDDELSTKDYSYDPVAQARWVLEDAGFKVEEARRIGDEMIIRFTWPTPTASAYINGAKRAFEALAPILKLRHDHYRGHRTGQTAEILIRKRIEEDPNLWKVIPAFGGHYDVVYNGQKVGNFWTEGSEEAAHRVREEMSFLSQITPFNPAGDYGPGNVYGTGPALGWWRAHRHRLSAEQRVGEYFLDRQLMAMPRQ